MSTIFPSRKVLAAAMFAALTLPALYGSRHPSAPNPDDYEALAEGFATTGTLSKEGLASAAREPAYPVALGTAFKLFGHRPAAVYFVNGLLAAGAVWGMFLVGSRLFGEGVGLLAALITAFYPPFIYYASQPRREIALVFLSVMSVMTLLKTQERTTKDFGVAGLINALTALTCTTFLPCGLGTVPVLLLWLGRKKLFATLRSVVVYCAFFVALYSLWPLRNYLTFHTLIMGVSTSAGGVFYVNQIVPSEVGGTEEEVRILAADPIMHEGEKYPDLVSREKFFWKKGVERIKEDPWRYFRLVAKRFFCDAWRVVPHERQYDSSYRLLWWVSLLSDGWIVPLGLIGLFFWRFKPPEAIFVPGFIASINLVYAMIFFIMRYRIPVMPWLILLASLTIVRTVKKLA